MDRKQRNRFAAFAMSVCGVLLLIGVGIGAWDAALHTQGASGGSSSSPSVTTAADRSGPSAKTASQQASGGGAGGAAGLRVGRVEGPLSPAEPFGPVWEKAEPAKVNVMPQNMTMPMLLNPSLSTVTVRALTDGERIAWCLRWSDERKDMNVDAGRFCDAVAIQFPVDRGAPFLMGGPNAKVQVLHWKGVWQKDINEHFQDVQDLHPNYWVDLYWFAEPTEQMGGHRVRYRVPESFQSEAAKQFFVAHNAGNPVSRFEREQPAEELVAEGFGTLTTQERSVTRARGRWKNGTWSVVFVRPLTTDDPLDYQFTEDSEKKFAIAVWEGSDGNVGGRKHWAPWQKFEMKP